MFFERHEGGERAILVHLEGLDEQRQEDPQEFIELVRSAGAENAGFLTISRHQPTPRFLIGSGKVDELRALVKASEGELVIFNHTLTPSQERNLERELECRVIDRTGLILDIFAQRARTHEGKLQVELAQLDHLSTRLVRGWTHLERQKGGIGLRGPGETQLETDRRLLRVRIKQITKRLEKVRSQRDQARRARRRMQAYRRPCGCPVLCLRRYWARSCCCWPAAGGGRMAGAPPPARRCWDNGPRRWRCCWRSRC